jgi:uncharacterized protein (DUF1697 family)
MIYVALLRGINVGGNSKVPMVQLKATFEKVGCQDVVTYINSGNIVFDDERTSTELINILEEAIKSEFGFHVPVTVRSAESIHKLCDKIPSTWMNDEGQKTDVVFLWDAIDKPDILKQLPNRPEIERVLYKPGAVIWNVDRKNATRSWLPKIIGTDLYKQMSIRNINTVRKLDALMKARKAL